MNPDQGGPGDRPPEVFGRTPAAAARAAPLLALLGVAMIAGVARYFTRPGTPLGEGYRATGLPRDLFLARNDFTRGWLCWQRARVLAPTHQLLDDVTAYEKQREADHPEYFRADGGAPR